ncbi:MAG: hypothetical protein CVT85_05270 [Alphaproteobacteria bacterium HGW-Alphaproteobacteria-7]|nr:MAG: hypothetical protein CVT85_05270 [Alphaproteobacteria bacterium HGW-Alphaproteobacteria-7]
MIGVFRYLLLVFALAGVLFTSPAAAMPTGSNKLTLSFDDLVADDAGVLTAEFKEEMQERLAQLQERAGVAVVLVTSPGLQGADSGKLSSSVGEKLEKLGKIGKHWVVFVLVPADRVFSASFAIKDKDTADAFQSMEDEEKLVVGRIFATLFEEAVVPHFKADQWQAGLRAGVNALESHLDEANQPGAPPTDDGDGAPAT